MLNTGLSRLIVVATLALTLTQPTLAEGKKLALLVGVEQYKHGDLTPLKFCCDDVKKMAGVLTAQGFTCRVLADEGFDAKLATSKPKADATGPLPSQGLPTRTAITTELKNLLKDVGKEDLVLIVLSGHGLQPEGATQPYFCPLDANPTTRLETVSDAGGGKVARKLTRPETLVGIGDLLGQLKESGVGQKLILVDACRNSPGSKGSKSVGASSVSIDSIPECSVLMSCKKGEQSFEDRKFGPQGGGAFLTAVIEGLEGQAADAEGAVSWDSLVSHVKKRVTSTVEAAYNGTEKQTPNQIQNSSAHVVLAMVTPKPGAVGVTPATGTPTSASSAGSATEELFEDFRSVEEFGLPDGWEVTKGLLGVRQAGRAHFRTKMFAKEWETNNVGQGPGVISTVRLPPTSVKGDFDIELTILANPFFDGWIGKKEFSIRYKNPSDEEILLRSFETEFGFIAAMKGSEESKPFSLAGRTPYRVKFSRIAGAYRLNVNSKTVFVYEANDVREFDICELTLSPDVYVGSIRIGPPKADVPTPDASKKSGTSRKSTSR